MGKQFIAILTAACSFFAAGVVPSIAAETYHICHGDDETQCKLHPYDKFEPAPPAANPAASVNYLCGTKPGGQPNGSFQGSYAPISGGCCGTSWFEVRCY
jgi:hypothetical protein